jgi:hypothetical protein
MMNRRVFERMAHLLKHSARVALLAILLGALGAFLLGSFASPAHAAASASPADIGRATVEVRTFRANSFRVTEVTSSDSLTACYSTPTHQPVVITLPEGRAEFVGYSRLACTGAILCEKVVTIPLSGFLIITLC